MSETKPHTYSGDWEILYSNATGADVFAILTSRDAGVSWAVRDDTTLPSSSFLGHSLVRNEDFQRIIDDGETLFLRGPRGGVLYFSLGGG